MGGEQAFLGFVCVVLGGFGLVVRMVVEGAASGAIRRNSVLGMRTSSTMASDEAWRLGHDAARPIARFGAWATLGVAVLALVVTVVSSNENFGAAAVLLVCALLVGVTAIGGARAHGAARAAPDSDGLRK